jgi:predicted peptidase
MFFIKTLKAAIMCKIFPLTLCVLLFVANTFGQNTAKPSIKKYYLNRADSTKNCYTLVNVPKQPLKGYLVLVPGFGETAADVLFQTDLPRKLAQNGILTIIPTFQDAELSFGVDSSSQHSLSMIIEHVVAKYDLSTQKMYLGGFSIGGSCVIKYAENVSLKPAAVFAIDPPLDFERFYNSAQRDLRLAAGNGANPENVYMINRLEKEAGGKPTQKLSAYYELSPYSYTDTTQTATRKLINTPIRIYTEPDIHWWLQERKADFTSMNATECSAMINELRRMGNRKAALITTINKGYRKPNYRKHPHSWSIVNNEELIKWLLKQP